MENQESIRLLESVSPSTLKLLEWISEKAGQRQVSIYIVGGFVRDLILHHPTTDFDIVIEGDAINFAKSLFRALGGRLVTHSTFRTAVWNIHSIQEKLQTELGLNESDNSLSLPKHIDFITAREESYPSPAALPVVKPGTINSDLGRRDFTINTLAINMNIDHFGELLDPFEGYKDIRNGSVRVLHARSFIDDPTRQLRAVRFEQRFGFQIDNHTLQLMEEARQYLGKITGIRIRHELDLMFKEEHFDRMFARAQELGILSAIHPSLKWETKAADSIRKISQLNWEPEWGIRPSFGKLDFKTGLKYCLWLTPLSIQDQKSVTQRLCIPQTISSIVNKVHDLSEMLPSMKELPVSEITFLLDKFPVIATLVCSLSDNDLWIIDTLKQYLIQWRKMAQKTDGHDLRNLGLPTSSVYRTILTTLRAGWLDGQIHSAAEEQILLIKLLKQQRDDFKN